MQLTLICLIVIQGISVAYCFRDYPASYSEAGVSQSRPCKNCTVFEKSYKKALSRKRRAFVFIKNTLLVITDVAASGLLSNYPRAIYQSMEIDLYYKVPLAVDGWRKPLDEYINGIRAQKKAYEEEKKEDERLQNIGTVNVSSIPLDEYNKMPFIPPTWRPNWHPNLQNGRRRIGLANQRNYQPDYRRPYYRGSSQHYYPNLQRRTHMQTPNRYYSSPQRRIYERPNDQSRYNAPPTPARPTVPTTTEPGDQSLDDYAKRSIRQTPSWHHHREYRERRDIYEHLETFGKILGMNLRKCIMRAICEMKERLLPEGESFINDIARILFTVPTDHDNKDDEYTQIAMEEKVNCARRFMISCPHSPLEYFLKNFRATAKQPTKPPTEQDVINSIIYA